MGQMSGYKWNCVPPGSLEDRLRIGELVDNQAGIEFAPTNHPEVLFAPLPPPTTISSENSSNMVIIISSDNDDEE